MRSLVCRKWSQGLIPSFPILPCLGLGTLSTPIHTKQGGPEKQTAVQGVVETMPRAGPWPRAREAVLCWGEQPWSLSHDVLRWGPDLPQVPHPVCEHQLGAAAH